MKRKLPAVGNRISIHNILRSCIHRVEPRFMERLFPNCPIYLVSSGSAALYHAFMAVKALSKRRKVIIPAYTCPSVLAAVEAAGFRTVLCDLTKDGLQVDLKNLSYLADQDTAAVTGVHLFGYPEKSQEIKEIAHRYGALYIEDAAQAFGGYVGDKPIGADGDLAILSFGRGKPLSVLHGGAVIANNPELVFHLDRVYNTISQRREKGLSLSYYPFLVAYAILFNPSLFWIPHAMPWFKIGETHYNCNIRMMPMAKQARRMIGVLETSMEKIEAVKRRIVRRYETLLVSSNGNFSRFYEKLDDGIVPLRYPIQCKNRMVKMTLLSAINDEIGGASGSYPVPLNEQAGVPQHIRSQGPFPNAKLLADRLLTLPVHEYVRDVDIKRIANILNRDIQG